MPCFPFMITFPQCWHKDSDSSWVFKWALRQFSLARTFPQISQLHLNFSFYCVMRICIFNLSGPSCSLLHILHERCSKGTWLNLKWLFKVGTVKYFFLQTILSNVLPLNECFFKTCTFNTFSLAHSFPQYWHLILVFWNSHDKSDLKWRVRSILQKKTSSQEMHFRPLCWMK